MSEIGKSEFPMSGFYHCVPHSRPMSSQPRSSQLLGLEAAAEMESYFLDRDLKIARYFGLAVQAVTTLRGQNPLAWCYFEGRLHDGSRTPQLTWEEHSALSALARAAQALDGGPVSTTGIAPSRPTSLSARLLWFFHRLTGAALVVIGGCLGALWLAHHAFGFHFFAWGIKP